MTLTQEEFDTATGADRDPPEDLIPSVHFTVACDKPVGVVTVEAISDVIAERQRQVMKWGPQHHPDGTSTYWAAQREMYRQFCDDMAAAGKGTWFNILREEFFEAAAEVDPVMLRKELIQVAAVATAWVEDIDTRNG